MASATTTEFVRSTSHADSLPFTLIQQPGLISRLVRELNGAFGELIRDPLGFVKGLFVADTKDAKRRQRIQIGVAVAVVLHVALLAIIAVLGWRTMFVKTTAESEPEKVTWVKKPFTSGEEQIPNGDKKGGSGGGGDSNPLPATKGPKPQMSDAPQVVKPNTLTSVMPTIQLPSTIVGPDSSAPPPGVPLGIPPGVIADAPSPGPGKGGGLGGTDGPGAGRGRGPGSGAGDNGGGPGGKNRLGLPTGREDAIGPIPFNRIDKYPDHTGIIWVHRPRPIITPEAETNKVMGEVLLRATFRDDGTITDVEIIRQVPYMTESAIDSLRHSTFRPATIKGRPVTLTGVLVRINVDVVQQ
jgi:hypothetical protein